MSKKCTPLWREAHFKVKMYKAHQVRTTFRSSDVEKVQPLWREAHFEVKMYKTLGVRFFFEVQMSKKCTPLWREAHFQVKSVKTDGPLLEVQMSKSVEKMRSCGAKHIWKSKV